MVTFCFKTSSSGINNELLEMKYTLAIELVENYRNHACFIIYQPKYYNAS